MNNDKGQQPQAQRQALLDFIATKKYLAEGLYLGASNEQDRVLYEALINELAERLMPLADRPDPKPQLLKEFTSAYPAFEFADTEDRERTLDYFEELMDILGVESSDGLLNKLMYGFDASQSAETRNEEALASMSEAERQFADQLSRLTRQSALDFLTTTLGKPSMRQANMSIWLRDDQPNSALSLSDQAGQAVLTWMVKGRFMYSRTL